MGAPRFFELALRLSLELVALTQRIFALRTGTWRVGRLRIHLRASCQGSSEV